MGVSWGQFAVHARRGLDVSTFDEWCRRARAAVRPSQLERGPHQANSRTPKLGLYSLQFLRQVRDGVQAASLRRMRRYAAGVP